MTFNNEIIFTAVMYLPVKQIGNLDSSISQLLFFWCTLAYPSVASVPTSYYLMWHYNQLPLNSRGLRMYVCMCVGFILWRARRVLENRQNMDDDRMGQLEISLKEAQDNATEADKKYEEVSLTAKFNLYSTIFGVCRWLQHWVSQAHFCNIFFHFFPDHFQHMHQERALLCVH